MLSKQYQELARADFDSKVPLKEAGYEALVEALGEELDEVLTDIRRNCLRGEVASNELPN